MPVYPALKKQTPDFMSVFGHSYWQYQFGTRWQAGRADALLRQALDLEYTNWFNSAENGSKLIAEGNPNGGFARLLQSVTTALPWAAPYVGVGGSYFLGWGINDLGFLTDTSQIRTAYQHALRMAISRCRASSIKEENNASIVHGASWTQLAFSWDFSSGQTIRQCTSAAADASHTFTITIPADYQGTPICLLFGCNPGATGGTITYGGTAGITGTSVVSAITPVGLVNRGPFVRRITNLTSANAGQTITCQMTAVDASGVVYFDGYWIEALNPPLVLVANIARLTATGYAIYTTPPNDAAVATWNTMIQGVVAEFDSMVQLVDIDSAIDAPNLGAAATGRTLHTDGLHPTELGASRMADATLAAIAQAQPTTLYGQTAQFNTPSQRSAALIKVHGNATWNTTETSAPIPTAGTVYAPVSGDQFSIPFFVSQSGFAFSQWSVDRTASGTAATVFFAVYSDRQYRAYPQYIFNAAANTTALSLGTGAGIFTSTTTPGSNGYLWCPADPGLYWLVLKVVAVGATNTWRTLTGQSPFLPNLTTAGGGNVSYNGYKLGGQGTGVMPGFHMTGGVLSTNCPAIGILMTWIGP